jgi:hypothetical protein
MKAFIVDLSGERLEQTKKSRKASLTMEPVCHQAWYLETNYSRGTTECRLYRNRRIACGNFAGKSNNCISISVASCIEKNGVAVTDFVLSGRYRYRNDKSSFRSRCGFKMHSFFGHAAGYRRRRACRLLTLTKKRQRRDLGRSWASSNISGVWEKAAWYAGNQGRETNRYNMPQRLGSAL